MIITINSCKMILMLPSCFMILPPFQIKKPNCPCCDLDDVTLGSPAILSVIESDKSESALVNFKIRGFPSLPHGKFGFYENLYEFKCSQSYNLSRKS
jgi:hypothetical protein